MTGHVTYFKSSKSLGLLWRGGALLGGVLAATWLPKASTSSSSLAN